MIIDSKVYSGPCACGRNHPMDTQLSIVEAGCLGKLDAYIAQCGLSGFRTVIYDENTLAAKGMVPITADQRIVLDPEGLHANEHGVALVMDQLSAQADYLVAVGSGTVHDITRYCAYLRSSRLTSATIEPYSGKLSISASRLSASLTPNLLPNAILLTASMIPPKPIA